MLQKKVSYKVLEGRQSLSLAGLEATRQNPPLCQVGKSSAVGSMVEALCLLCSPGHLFLEEEAW